MCRKDNPLPYQKHWKSTKRDWERDEVLAWTAGRKGEAQYSKLVFADQREVQALELLCINHGTEITPGGGGVRKFYMKCDKVIGACSGVLTEYIFAQCDSKGYHGRPISPAALAAFGVQI